MENGHGRTAVIYARVSTKEQAENGYSLRQQIERLMGWCADEGYEVLEEVTDRGQSGAYLDRPGLDRARALVEHGGVAVVLAQDRDRFAREPAYLYLLREEFASHGCAMRSLNDRGDNSPEGQLTDGILDQLAKFERAKTAERSRRGTRRKVSEGRILGASPSPRFGFRYDGARTGYEVDAETMPVMRRIFEMLAAGEPVKAVASVLDADGVSTPRGGAAWSRRTIREMALDDVYLPRGVGELVGQVPDAVLASLDSGGRYGVSYHGRVRVRAVSNTERVRETPGQEEWIGVPVHLDDSGLDAATVVQARRVLEGNRSPGRVADRLFELSGGVLRCAHCNRAMIGYARRHPNRAPNFYYRCDSPARTGSTCPNRRSRRAADLEHEAASLFEQTATRGALLDLYDRAIAEQSRRSGLRGSLERRTALVEKLGELDAERRGYLRQNARGVLSDADLDQMLTDVAEQREVIAAEMRRAEDAAATVRRMQEVRASLASADWFTDPNAITPDQWLTLGALPEEIRAAYQRFGARFEADQEGALTLRLELDLGNVANGSHIPGNEHWEFNDEGYMRRRDASINDYRIDESERRYR